MKKVGASERTRGKHDLLNKLIGREIGILERCPEKVGRYGVIPVATLVDLCAGSGEPSLHSETSSPEILLKHASHLWGSKKEGRNAQVILIERDMATFEVLMSSYSALATCIRGDAREIAPELVKDLELTDRHTFSFNADPNTVKDIPLTPEFLNVLPRYTTGVLTLGCNCGGAKRIERDEREKWREPIEIIARHLDRFHDGLLVTLNRDPSKWAYLVITCNAWRDRVEEDSIKAFKSCWDKGVTVDSFRQNPYQFFKRLDELFLTKEERRV